MRGRAVGGMGQKASRPTPRDRKRSHAQNFFSYIEFYGNQKIKEGIMPRGGKRAGAGRPRKPVLPQTVIRRFDLTDRLNAMPGGSKGQHGRFVLALSAYGASEREIAAALDVSFSQLSESDREHMLTGCYVAQANLLDQIRRKAEAGNTTALIWLHRKMERAAKSSAQD